MLVLPVLPISFINDNGSNTAKGMSFLSDKKRLKRRQDKTQRQARNHSKARKKTLKGMQEKTQRQASKNSKAGTNRLKGRQDKI